MLRALPWPSSQVRGAADQPLRKPGSGLGARASKAPPPHRGSGSVQRSSPGGGARAQESQAGEGRGGEGHRQPPRPAAEVQVCAGKPRGPGQKQAGSPRRPDTWRGAATPMGRRWAPRVRMEPARPQGRGSVPGGHRALSEAPTGWAASEGTRGRAPPQTKNSAWGGRAGAGQGCGRAVASCRGADKGAPPTTPGPASAAGPQPDCALRPARRGRGRRRWVFPRRLLRDGNAARGPSCVCCSGETAPRVPGPSPKPPPRTHRGRPGAARSAGGRGVPRPDGAGARSTDAGSGARVPPPDLGQSGCPPRAQDPGRRPGWGSGWSAMRGAPSPWGARGARRRAHRRRARAGGAESAAGGARAGPTNPAPRRGSARRSERWPPHRRPQIRAGGASPAWARPARLLRPVHRGKLSRGAARSVAGGMKAPHTGPGSHGLPRRRKREWGGGTSRQGQAPPGSGEPAQVTAREGAHL